MISVVLAQRLAEALGATVKSLWMALAMGLPLRSGFSIQSCCLPTICQRHQALALLAH
jgi:hypothetical protein